MARTKKGNNKKLVAINKHWQCKYCTKNICKFYDSFEGFKYIVQHTDGTRACTNSSPNNGSPHMSKHFLEEKEKKHYRVPKSMSNQTQTRNQTQQQQPQSNKQNTSPNSLPKPSAKEIIDSLEISYFGQLDDESVTCARQIMSDSDTEDAYDGNIAPGRFRFPLYIDGTSIGSISNMNCDPIKQSLGVIKKVEPLVNEVKPPLEKVD